MSGPYAAAVERFPAIRQSRLSSFDRCALGAYFEETYEHGWSSHPQARGKIIHAAFAQALRVMYETSERTIPTDAMIAILDEQLRQHDVDRVCPECPGVIVRRFMGQEGFPRILCENGHEHSSDFCNLPMSEVVDMRWVAVKWANDNAFDIENLVDVEQRIKATIRYPDGTGGYVERELSGALDALFITGANFDEAIVLDWKDTWGMPGPSDVSFDGYFQQRFYAWLVFKNYPVISKVTLREFYVRYSEPREAVVYRSDIEDIEAEFQALAERYDRAWATEQFPPTPGHHCQLCKRPEACPIFPAVRTPGAITDQGTAERYAQEAQVAKAALAARTKSLSAWASVHGPVEVSTHKGRRGWGHREIKRTARPTKEKLAEAVKLNGGRPLTDGQIEELYESRKGMRFELIDLTKPEPTADDAALMSALEQSIVREQQ